MDVVFAQRGDGTFVTVEPIRFRYRGNLMIVPGGYPFDALFAGVLADRLFPISLLDLRLFAALNWLQMEGAPDLRGLTGAARRKAVADTALRALKANGAPLLQRWAAWMALSWHSLLPELGHALHRQAPLDRGLRRHLGQALLVTVLLAVPFAFPFVIGLALPETWFFDLVDLDSALGAGVVAGLQYGVMRIARRLWPPRGPAVFEWLTE